MIIEIEDDLLRMITGNGPGAPLLEAVKQYLHGDPETRYRKQLLGDMLVETLERTLEKHSKAA